MADPKVMQIPRTGDGTILECFKHIADEYAFTIAEVHFSMGTRATAFDFDSPDSQINKIIKENSVIIDQIRLSKDNYHIYYYRGGRTHGPNGAVLTKSPFFDEITFATDYANLGDVHIEIGLYIANKLKAFDPERSLPGGSKEQITLESIHQSILERLEDTNSKLLKETHQYRLELDKEFSTKQTKLAQEVEDLKSKIQSDLEKKLLDIQAQKDQLATREKELDDRNNTHARRGIRRDIISEIKRRQEKFSLTTGTRNLRAFVFGLIALLVCVSFDLTYKTSNIFLDSIKNNAPIYLITIIGIKQTIYSLVLIGSIIFAIKWQDKWSNQHSDAEFNLKKFELDMERASWLVETSLEWKDVKGTAIPDELLKCLSNDLFAVQAARIDKAKHPMDQLASALLGSARGIKLKIGDNELDLDPKKLEKARSPEE
jgi:hypothetical protein